MYRNVQTSIFFISKRLGVMLGLMGLLLFNGSILSGCGECKYDNDCEATQLCKEGVCTTKSGKKEKPPEQECLNGELQPCYTGPPSTMNIGICAAGKQICNGNKWGSCQGMVLPLKELCDGQDNNCNGKTDEGCNCQSGKKRACYTGPAATRNKSGCKDGEQLCLNGNWGPCTGEKLPEKELCDNKDNDCDGNIDNDVKRSCQTKCGLGKEVCKNGKFAACDSPTPTPEKCGDNKDNNCNGSVDEGCECKPNSSRPCYTGKQGTDGKGPCKKGTQQCFPTGKWGSCVGQKLPELEKCNGVDDDCNGRTDDGLSRRCQRGCNAGTESCSNGKWQPCAAKPADPEICDGKDNDCNGKVDDRPPGKACECRIGQKESCYNGPKNTLNKGHCKAGQRHCQTTGKWSLCLGELTPNNEQCDGRDNDCDGSVDNVPASTQLIRQICYDGPNGTAGKGPCQKGTQTCTNGKWSTCLGQVKPTKETCNNKDDNCDGQIDEKLSKSCYSGKSGTAGKGSCKQGTQICSKGAWQACKGEVLPTAEKCNKKDDDCDGQTDEGGVCDVCKSGQTQSCYTGPTHTRGRSPCKDGKSSCVNGQWGSCQGEVKPAKEVCNGKDDDCDGKVDTGLSRACTTVCGSGSEFCVSGQWKNCNAPAPKTETCNGKDDDCDGQIDEGAQCARLATGGWDGQVFIWDPTTNKKKYTLFHPKSLVYALDFSPNKSQLAVGLRPKDVHIWDVKTGKKLRTLTTTDRVLSLQYAPDNKSIAAGTAKGIWIWDLTSSSGTAKRTIFYPGYVNGVAYHPKQNWLAIAYSQQVDIWNPSTGKKMHFIKFTYTVRSMAISKDGKYMLTGGFGGGKPRLELWSLATLPPKKLRAFNVPTGSIIVYHTGFSPDGSLITATSPGHVYIWNRSTGAQMAKLAFTNHWLYSASITANNRNIAIGGRTSANTKGHLYIFDLLQKPPKQVFHDTSHSNYLWTLQYR